MPVAYRRGHFSMKSFGTLPDGRATRLFTLENARGVRAEISDYGGTVIRLFAPDRHGKSEDVVLGFDTVAPYVKHDAYFGALIGRYGNRIAAGKFSLEGVSYTLPTNNRPGGRPCHLHGGEGFDKALWAAEPFAAPEGAALRLRHRSPDGDQGYPGTLDVTVVYTLLADNALRIDYSATTDQPTPVNLTNHSYFNLAGHNRGDVLGHELTLHASTFTLIDEGMIPTGKIASVAGTPFDFRKPRPIGAHINQADDQLRYGGGYDHNFVLDQPGASAAAVSATAPIIPPLAASVYEPSSGRMLEVFTTEPGVQFYSGNFLNGALRGKEGHVYGYRSGFCLETQHFPDSPNQPTFPSTLLRPGQTYRTTTIYRFTSR